MSQQYNMTTHPTPGHAAEPRSGIALVMLLGMLSILVLLAVAFATSMRTERLAAKNYNSVVEARNLVYTGLAQARDHLHYTLTNSVSPDTALYPTWGTWPSAQGPGSNSGILKNSDDQDDDEIQKFVPSALWAAVQADAGAAVQWNHVLDPNNASKAVGRVSYIIVDSTGLLDVHEVHRVDREEGATPEEIRLPASELSEFAGQVNADNTDDHVNFYRRFETLPELLNLGSNSVSGNSMFNGGSGLIENLFVHSGGAQGYFDVTQTPPVAADQLYIGATGSEVQGNDSAIRSALAKMGGIPDTAVFAANIRDYVDEDDVPGNNVGLATYCTEAVPMINEVRMTHRVTRATDGVSGDVEYKNEVTFDVELWYPFVNSSPNDYQLEIRVIASGATPSDFNLGGTLTGAAHNNPHVGPSLYYQDQVKAEATYVDSSGGSPPTLPTRFGARMSVKNMATDTAVDQVDIRMAGTMEAFFGTMVPSLDGASTGDNTREADDPRINWDWADNAQWIDLGPMAPGTPGAMNATPAADGARPLDASPMQEGRPEMYVANAAMKTIGQMGDLLYDQAKPWETIPLLDAPGDLQVATFLRVYPEEIRPGLVNPNSANPAVLASVWNQQRQNNFPWESSGTRYTAAQADAIAAGFESFRAAHSDTDVFTNRGDVCAFPRADLEAVLTGAGIPSTSRMESEMVMRDAIGLFNTRHHLYTIIIDAEAGVDDNSSGTITDEEVMAKQKAVAVLWRDPFITTPKSGYASTIKTFKWLTE